MSAAEVLRLARAAGISVGIDGDNLVLEAALPPPFSMRCRSTNLPSSPCCGLRAADGRPRTGMSISTNEPASSNMTPACRTPNRNDARSGTASSSGSTVIPPRRRPDAARGAVGRRRKTAVVLPFGTEPGTHVWLHAECWPAWHRARRDEAVVALRSIGIMPMAR
jgi:hypothetical protein